MINYFYGRQVYPTGYIEGSKSDKIAGSFVKYMDDTFYYGYDVIEGRRWPWMMPLENKKIDSNFVVKSSDDDGWKLSAPASTPSDL